MSEEHVQSTSLPQYIVTTPSEVDTEEECSLQETAADAMTGSPQKTTKSTSTTSKIISQSIQKQVTKKTSRITSMAATTSQSIESMLADSAIAEHLASATSIETNIVQQQKSQQLQQNYEEHNEIQGNQQLQQQSQIAFTQKSTTVSSSNRSQSLKSSSKSEEHDGTMINVTGASPVLSTTSAQLDQQLKAHSSTSLTISEQQQRVSPNNTNIMQKISLVSGQQQNTKTKFQSFLQQPEAGGHLSSSGNYLTAHQKHMRQFVRSTSAHSEATAAANSVLAREQKCMRSASTQQDEKEILHHVESSASNTKLGLQQTSSVLLSKSAETIEMKTTSTGMRTQLTLSGGFLAPPNRKITILSPIHAPPGLHDMLKRSGRSPLSPRISFPGTEADLFG